MAREIKDTPVLSGKDAELFFYNMEHPKPMPQKIKEGVREMIDYFKKHPELAL